MSDRVSQLDDCRVQELHLTHGEAEAQRGKQLSGAHGELEAEPRL